MPTPFKEVSAGALNGVLDLSSLPELMDSGAVRYRQNFQNTEGRMGRRQGWTRFLPQHTTGNSDLHDQMLALQLFYADLVPKSDTADDLDYYPNEECDADLSTRGNGREFITCIYDAVTIGGSHVLIACTQSRIYEFNYYSRQWRILGDGFGGNASDLSRRFVIGGPINDVLVISNNFDPIQHYIIGDEPRGCAMRCVHPIPILTELKVSKAAEVLAFKDTMLMANVVIDGARIANRIIASDYKDALAYDLAETTAEDSTASFQDLPHGHEILRILPWGDGVLVYTTRSIYRGVATGSADKPIEYSVYYQNKDGKKCLAYKNAIVEYGNAHYYLGRDAIYKIDNFTDGPEAVEWLNKSSSRIFSSINESACESHCAGVWPYGAQTEDDKNRDGELIFSWAKRGSNIPVESIGIQPETRFTDVIDHGFTTFANVQPDSRPTIGDWLLSICACNDVELAATRIKDGVNSSSPSCDTVPTVVFSHETMEFEDLVVENYLADEAADDSLCAVLGDISIDDYCLDCQQPTIFVAASSRDKCIKQFGGAFSREFCLNSEIGEGSTDCGDPTTLDLRNMARSLFIDPAEGASVGLSGITYSPVTETVFGIRNVAGGGDSEIYEWDRNGVLIRTIVTTNFTDTEGICWMSGNTFAIAEENPDNRITIVTITDATTTLDRSDFTATSFDTNAATDNLGVEGVAYDPVRDLLYFTTEKAQSGVWSIWTMNPTTGAVAELVESISGTVGASVTDIADIYYDQYTQHLFMLSQESNKVIEVTLDGYVVRELTITDFDQAEGLAFTPNMATMFITGEAAQFARYSNSDVTCFTYTPFTGQYSSEGYQSIIRLGPLPMGEATKEKTIMGLVAEWEAAQELNTNVVAIRLGYSFSPLDANKEDCGVVWTPYERNILECVQRLSPEEYRAQNLRPATGKIYKLFQTGRYFYIEMVVSGLQNQSDIRSDLVPAIGGESYFSSLRLRVRK
jgi:uncharacterized protein YjiK